MHIHPRSSPYNKKVHSYDGIVEAVRRDPDGKVTSVRYYPRHGEGFADVFILTRDELISALKGKKKYIAGKRVQYMGGLFDLGGDIKLAENESLVIEGASDVSGSPELADLPHY